jgi:hypothetical protein
MAGEQFGRSDDVSIDFSTEELLALVQISGSGPLPGLDLPTLQDDSRLANDALDAATRSLIARHAVRVVGPDLEVVNAVSELIAAVTAPGILGKAEREADENRETRYFSATAEVTVERRMLTEGVHRLTVFSSSELLVRMLEFCRLSERTLPEAKPFDLSAGDLERCQVHARAGASEDALGVLRAAAVNDSSAQAFVRALAGCLASSRVAIVHRPSKTVVEGGELSWIDAGDQGLWLMPTIDARLEAATPDTDALTQHVTIEPTTAPALAAECYSYLPASASMAPR